MSESKEAKAYRDKVNMTDDERAALSAKLDEDLDTFIAGLEKKSYSDGWNENNWEKEMAKHPFFMSEQPKEGEKLPPLMEGLQQLKYDNAVNTPEELASNYKEDGNFNFKCKNYRKAILSYSEGLKQKSSDMELNAQLYNNRAACHFILKNYRSCYYDCKEAIKANVGYRKAQIRLAECCSELELYDECIQNCDLLLRSDRKNEKILTLRRNADRLLRGKEMNERKEYVFKHKAELEKKKLVEAIQSRGIRFLESNFDDLDLCTTLFVDVFKRAVHLVKDRLVWPVVFMYPEHKLTDFIQEFHEDCTFQEQLEHVFAETPDWDKEKKYKPKYIRIYYEGADSKVHNANKSSTLGKVLSETCYRVDRGTPVFLLFVRDSQAERQFLASS